MKNRPRIGIIGAGALGCYYGASILRGGGDVHFLMRRDYEAVKTHGLMIHSCNGDFRIAPPIYNSAAAMGPCDLLIVGLKTTDNHKLAELLGPAATSATDVLTLQNGLGNEERIARVLEDLHGGGTESAIGRVLGGVAFLCCHRGEPGVVHHTDHGHVKLAEAHGVARERTRAVAQMFIDGGVACEVCDSLNAIRWEKLVWNIPFNGLGVAAGHADTQVLLGDAELTELVRGLMREAIESARAADGVEIDPGIVERMIDYTGTMGAYRSSMQIDYENGRPLEVESIVGEPLRRARRAGLEPAKLQMLYACLKRLDELNRAG